MSPTLLSDIFAISFNRIRAVELELQTISWKPTI